MWLNKVNKKKTSNPQLLSVKKMVRLPYLRLLTKQACHKAERGTGWHLTTGWWQQLFLLSEPYQQWNATVSYCSVVVMVYVKSIFSVWIHSVREEKTQTQIFSAQFLTRSIWQQMAARPLHRWDIHLSLDCLQYCLSQWLHFFFYTPFTITLLTLPWSSSRMADCHSVISGIHTLYRLFVEIVRGTLFLHIMNHFNNGKQCKYCPLCVRFLLIQT